MYGTSLRHREFQVRSIFSSNALSRRLIANLSLFTLRQELLARYARGIRHQFDLMISTFNEMDLGSEGIQYIHAPTFSGYNLAARRALNYPDSRVRAMAEERMRIDLWSLRGKPPWQSFSSEFGVEPLPC